MKTLREMVEAVRAGEPLEVELGDFLDAFYRCPSEALLQEAPELLGEGQESRGAVTMPSWLP